MASAGDRDDGFKVAFDERSESYEEGAGENTELAKHPKNGTDMKSVGKYKTGTPFNGRDNDRLMLSMFKEVKDVIMDHIDVKMDRIASQFRKDLDVMGKMETRME